MRFSTKLALVVAVVAVCVLPAGASYATTIWNAAGDFSEAGNPNGDWSYGYLTDSTFSLLSSKASTNSTLGPTGLIGWAPSSTATDPNILKNATGSNIVAYGMTWTPGQLTLGPAFSDGAVVRWTAPAAGSYSIDADFLLHQSEIPQPVYVYHNNTQLFSGLTDFATSYSLSSITVAAGDTIDFRASGDPKALVALDATIGSVPEPGTLVLLGVGLFGLSAYAWRKRK